MTLTLVQTPHGVQIYMYMYVCLDLSVEVSAPASHTSPVTPSAGLRPLPSFDPEPVPPCPSRRKWIDEALIGHGHNLAAVLRAWLSYIMYNSFLSNSFLRKIVLFC